ncbi:sensor histidine kinase [Alteromonas gracilis]|uniref:sensor histidine kinase n=1 Tax=Alteromonas gracilis TaxID=1479524 RepID=UPI003734CEDF
MSLTDEVARLKRRLERERKARQSAESLLDDYAKKTYLANEKLRDAIVYSTEKQAEIEFLVKSTQEHKNSSSRQTFVESLLDLCFEFTSASYATCLFSRHGELESNPLVKGKLSALDGDIHIAHLIPISIDSIINSWCIQEVPVNECAHKGKRTVWFVYSNFAYDQSRLGWIGLLIETPTIEEGMLFILDTHLAQLRMGLEKLNMDKSAEQKFKLSSKLQEELIDVKKQLAIADRMSSLGVLASGVAHEINNPLAFISANNKYLKKTLSDLFASLNALSDSSSQDANIQSMLSKLENIEQNVNEVLQDNLEGIERLSNISDSLRTFVYRGETELTPVDLNELASHAAKIASYSKQYKHTLRLELFEGKAMVNANRGELEQVVLNIIINALHATSKNNGSVVVSVGASDGSFFVSIKDSGVGISEENLEKIFSPFFTTKPVGEGTGLGLAISKNIIDAHNGTLAVESTENVGTCFTITMPKVNTNSMEQLAECQIN